MIIKVLNGNSIIKWKYNDKDKWKYAEISDLIKAYERLKDCSDCKRYDFPYFEIKINKDQLQELVDKAKAEILASIERPHGEWGETEAVIEDDKCEEIKHVKVYYHIGCPNMGKYLKTTSSFCPNCGADMRKPNCVTCDHFGKCEGCEKGDEE